MKNKRCKREEVSATLYLKRAILLILCLLLSAAPLCASAQTSAQKEVRVGWFDSLYNYIGDNGRRSGYGYVYQQKVASYTGWKYKYVEGSWPELLEKLKSGEIDLLTDVSYTEERNISATDSLMQTEIYALVRKRDHLRELSQGEMNVAIDEGDVNGEIFAAENFPHWTVVSSSGQESGYKAVEKKEADCLLLSNFLIPATEPLREQYSLTPVPTGKAMYYSFAVRRTDGDLCMILNKLIGLVPATSVESAALSYS